MDIGLLNEILGEMINVANERHELEIQIFKLFETNNYTKYDLFNLFYIKSFTKKISSIIENIIKVKTKVEITKYKTIRAAYSDLDDTIYIRIPKIQLLNYFKKSIPIENIYCSIVDLSVHELIHYKQCQKDKIRKTKIFFGCPIEQYISDEKEIEAWAAFTVSNLLRQFKKEEIMHNLKHNHETLTNVFIFNLFTRFKYNSPKIWKRFINKMVLHLNLM